MNKRDGSEGMTELKDSKFDEVFRRLDRIEARVFPRESAVERSSTNGDTLSNASTEANTGELVPQKWSVDPGHLQREYAGFILFGNIFKVLSESHDTVESISKKYFEHTHNWLPIISPTRFEKNRRLFKDFKPDDNFLLTILAMHLIVTPCQKHPPADSIKDSPWYRACKHYFGQHIAFGETSLDLIQAGMLIALFEHTQAIGDRALLTLGVCARVAYALELDTFVSEQVRRGEGEMSVEDEEAVHTWWGLILLDRWLSSSLILKEYTNNPRYLNMPPAQIAKQPVVQQKPFQISFFDIRERPCVSSFTEVYGENLDHLLMELEASRMLAQVQAVMRENRHRDVAFLSDVAPPIARDVNQLVDCLKKKQQQASTFSGVVVALRQVFLAPTFSL